MLAIFSYYYAQNYAGIFAAGLHVSSVCGVRKWVRSEDGGYSYTLPHNEVTVYRMCQKICNNL